MSKLLLFSILCISSFSLSFGEEEKSNLELQTIQLDNKTFNVIITSDVNVTPPINKIIISNLTNIVENNDVDGKIYKVMVTF